MGSRQLQTKGRTMADRSTTPQQKAARRVAGLLKLADDAARQGDEVLRDKYLEKAAALQMEYAIKSEQLAAQGHKTEEIIFSDFCGESNTPMIKAKRQLIAGLAFLFRGRSVLMGARNANGRWDKRAYVRVSACASDLSCIAVVYSRLVGQLAVMMANDEQRAAWEYGAGKIPNGWRVSYAHSWVNRVYARMLADKKRQEGAAAVKEPGTALVLFDRDKAVGAHLAERHGKLREAKHRRSEEHTSELQSPCN